MGFEGERKDILQGSEQQRVKCVQVSSYKTDSNSIRSFYSEYKIIACGIIQQFSPTDNRSIVKVRLWPQSGPRVLRVSLAESVKANETVGMPLLLAAATRETV